MKGECTITGCRRTPVPAHAHCRAHLDDLYRRIFAGPNGILTIRRLPDQDPPRPFGNAA